jgi:hypothetical protein
LAVSAAVLQAALKSRLPPPLEYIADSTYALPPNLESDTESEAVLDAYMFASRAVFILQVPLIGLCLLGCVLIKDLGLQQTDDGNEGSRE